LPEPKGRVWLAGRGCAAEKDGGQLEMAAINQLRYSQQYEKLKAQGLSHDEAHLKAVQFATTKPKAKKKKESRLKRLARLTKMAVLGKHYKVPKEARPRKPETVRTKAVTKRLRVAGLTEAEMRRLKGR